VLVPDRVLQSGHIWVIISGNNADILKLETSLKMQTFYSLEKNCKMYLNINKQMSPLSPNQNNKAWHLDYNFY